jgi:hypothetical protein
LQKERTFFRLRPVAKSALAGLLGVLLFIASLLAANPFHHQSFHSGNAANSHLCVICMFASGQVNAADVAPILTDFVSSFVELTPAVPTILLTSADYLLSPSRGPPSVSSSSTVEG